MKEIFCLFIVIGGIILLISSNIPYKGVGLGVMGLSFVVFLVRENQ